MSSLPPTLSPNHPRDGLTSRVAERTYRGIWVILRDWFRVPPQPPTLPTPLTGTLETFRPSAGFLRYLKLQFWLFVAILNGAILVAWLVLTITMPALGAILAIPALVIVIVPDIIIYIALQLRFDTTWYVMSDRSIRMRRGIWIIQEITITFENVQNVTVAQGPVQRYFGIADVTIMTAGGGGSQGATTGGHQGVIEGISNADQMRNVILEKVKESRHAGLGDERRDAVPQAIAGWSPAHIALLRDIRDAARSMSASA